jgi:2-oxo-4-hydroxy-4-carboxy-5-ureidoimidazoline decarboxylase
LASIEDFNALPQKDAEDRLYACLANRRWAADLAARRPYAEAGSFHAAAIGGLDELTDDEWAAAFNAHPQIGERGGEAPERSEREQSSVMRSPVETLAALAAENRQYQDKFGHIFLIRASGRSGQEILSELRRRMKNNAQTELGEARRELAQIASERLSALVS